MVVSKKTQNITISINDGNTKPLSNDDILAEKLGFRDVVGNHEDTSDEDDED